MDKMEIETRLALGVQDAVPPLADSTLSACLDHQERNNTMEPTYTPVDRPDAPPIRVEQNKRPRAVRWLAAGIAAVFLLAFGAFYIGNLYAVDTVISIDVNPGIQIQTNKSSKVLSVTPLNADAEEMLSGLDLKGSDLDKAVDTLLLTMIRYGYIDDLHNSVLISVESSRSQNTDDLRQGLSDKVRLFLQSNAVDAAVVSQTLSNDEALKALASQYGITLGKAALIDLLVQQDARYTFGMFADTSINDILLLLYAKQTDLAGTSGATAKGQPSSGSYIGEDAAKSIALQHAGVTESQTSSMRIKLDWDDGRMVYDIEFYVGSAEYEYEIDAVSGQVVESDIDGASHGNSRQGSGNMGGSSGGSSSSSGFYIGETAATDIALNHAGLSPGAVSSLHVKFDWDDGHAVYDVEFRYRGVEYEYEIDAVTGAIREWDTDYDD